MSPTRLLATAVGHRRQAVDVAYGPDISVTVTAGKGKGWPMDWFIGVMGPSPEKNWSAARIILAEQKAMRLEAEWGLRVLPWEALDPIK